MNNYYKMNNYDFGSLKFYLKYTVTDLMHYKVHSVQFRFFGVMFMYNLQYAERN